MTESHREAFSGLMYAIHARKGFVVLTGDAGTGKTTLLRALMRSSKAARFSLILNPTLNLKDFLEAVLLDFGIDDVPDSKAQRIMKLQDFLVKLHELGDAPVLIIDEAHKLSPEILEEIRLLTNFETTDKKLLQIVLAGQTELAAVLNRVDLRQLKQRIEIRLEVKPLSPSDVRLYMLHRWERAGGATDLPFTIGAVSIIAGASRGIPRLVNAICDNALLTAFGEATQVITGDHVRQVLRDLDIRDVPPEANPARVTPLRPRSGFGPPAAHAAAAAVPFSLPTIERYCPGTTKVGLMNRLAAKLNLAPVKIAGIGNE
jgi:general secretion pathway protein A